MTTTERKPLSSMSRQEIVAMLPVCVCGHLKIVHVENASRCLPNSGACACLCVQFEEAK